MERFVSLSFFVLIIGLSACSDETSLQNSANVEYRTVEWTDLLPADDLDALLNPPDYLSTIDDGSALDQLDSNLRFSPTSAPNRYEQALVSTQVKEEFDRQKIRIPGFIVPLEFNENDAVTAFFLVPFFGACIHEPPPPPNQIVYSEFEAGKKVDNIQDAVWITGTMATSIITNELATSAYSIIVDAIAPYQ
jgi:uncharacterized protein